MSHHGTKPLSQIKVFLAGLVDRTDRAICAKPDERARRHGWTVTRTGFGARHYRDPRFDRLREDQARSKFPQVDPSSECDDLLQTRPRSRVPTGLGRGR
jgi:hypothetical protein